GDEGRDALDRGRPPIEPLERIEQVAGAELRPEQREGVRAGNGVEAQVVTESEHGAALARRDRERLLERPQSGAVGLERVAVRSGFGADTHARLLLAHLVPDLA